MRTRPEAHDGLAGIDGDANGEVRILLPEAGDLLQDRESGVDCAYRIVFMRERCAEHPHHRVADELVQRPAEALEHLLHASVIRNEGPTNVLRVRMIGPFGEAHEIDEQDRDDPSFLGSDRRPERRSASHAESSLGRVRRAAARTRNVHERSLGGVV